MSKTNVAKQRMPFRRMLREGKWLCEGDYIARVFDEGNFVAIDYREVSSNFVGHRLRRHHNVLCHPLRG